MSRRDENGFAACCEGRRAGKQLAARILPELAPGADIDEHDASTSALIAHIRARRG